MGTGSHQNISVPLELAVAEGGEHAIFTVDMAGEIQSWNRGVKEILGYEPDEWIGRPLSLLFSEEDRLKGADRQELERALREGRSIDDYWLVRKSGDRFFGMCVITPVRAADGTPLGFLKVLRDGTAKHLASELIKTTEERLRRAVRDAPIPISIHAEDGELLELSGAWESLTGYTRGELRSVDDWLVRAYPDPAPIRALIQGLFEGPPGIQHSGEFDLRTRWGTKLTWLFSSSILPPLADGRKVMISMAMDITERKAAEAEREELLKTIDAERNRLHEVFERSPAFMVIMEGPDHVLRKANDTYRRLTGSRETIGKPLREAFPEFGDQEFLKLVDQVYRSEIPWAGRDVRVEFEPASGGPREERRIDLALHPLREPDGRVSGVFCHGMDLTEQRRLEQAIRDSEERFRAVAELVPDLLWSTDARGAVSWYNKRWLDFTGLIRKEGILLGWLRALHPEDREQAHQRFEEAMRSATPFRDEHRVRNRDGEYRWFLARAEPLRDNNGAVDRWFGAETDVNEQRIAMDALRQSEASLRQLADAMPQMVWQARPDGQTDYYNRRWYEYTGLTSEDMERKNWGKVIPSDELQQVRDAWRRHVASGEPFEYEFRIRRAVDGAFRWHLVRALPVRDESGQIVKWFGTCTDIDDAKRLQEENQKLLNSERAAREEAENANRLKDEFLATLSHELRTPLNAILGWSQLLTRGRSRPEDYQQGMEAIARNALSQKELIADLLDMSRIISGKVRLNVQAVDPLDTIKAAIDVVKPAATSKGIRIITDLDSHVHIISGDPHRLQQVIWNLLSNAVKFTPQGGEIRVGAHAVDDSIEISVSDTGKGIKREFLPHVFERFRQEDASITRKHGGLGLGLSIVKQLVELHGGNVDVDSAGEGLGATFSLRLPVAVLREEERSPAGRIERPAARQPEVLDCSVTNLAGVKVLVVDDEPDARALIARILSQCGAEVSTAGLAAEGFSLLQRERPDILVSDIGMPGEDGYELMRKVRSLPPERGGYTPAIALTAFAGMQDQRKALAAGYQLHLGKPVEPGELLRACAMLVGVLRGERDTRAQHH